MLAHPKRHRCRKRRNSYKPAAPHSEPFLHWALLCASLLVVAGTLTVAIYDSGPASSGAVPQRLSTTAVPVAQIVRDAPQAVPAPPAPESLQRTLDSTQIANGRLIVTVAKESFSTPAEQRDAAVVAIATALQESSLRNRDSGDRDSVGLFQQRPSQGWGSAVQLQNPRFATRQFLQALSNVPNWEDVPPGEAAQTVQYSAYPDAYEHWTPLAREMATALW